jgi:hypothetical protein
VDKLPDQIATDIAEAIDDIAVLLERRLGLDEDDARDMASAHLMGTIDNAIASIRSTSVGPTSIVSLRVQLVENIAFRLGRLPSARELTALLRIPDSSARTLVKNVLAMSDRVNDLALKSAFTSAKREGVLGSRAKLPRAQLWSFPTLIDLEQARTQLEERGIRHLTQSDADGTYVLGVDPAFDPAKL